MDLAGIYHKANILIAQTYGITGVPEKGYVIVTVNNVRYIVYFYKIESGWNIEKLFKFYSKIILWQRYASWLRAYRPCIHSQWSVS